MTLCSHCGIDLQPHEVEGSPGKPVCMFCTGFADTNGESDTKWREHAIGQFNIAMGNALSSSEYLDNPGAVPGHNMYTVHQEEVKRFIELNNFLQDMFLAAFGSAPQNSTSERALYQITGALQAASQRAEKHFRTPGKAAQPLFVIDGAVDEGGPEATEYLTIVRTAQANYAKFQRVYYETRQSIQAMKQAQADAPKWFAMIGHMAMHGTIGKGKSEGYDRFQRGQKRP